MDIYSFINSKDIRNYLKEINYEFSPVEAAWLVYQCKNLTLEEKHKAWQEIIDTTSDCSIKSNEGCNFNGYKSLHTFLKECMTYDCMNFVPWYIDTHPFDFINIDIPVPFKIGDIVHIKHQNDNIFVYDKRNYENNEYISTACYFVDCGRISYCYMHATDYVMNMEYFNKEIPSNKSTLHTLSRYLKKEIINLYNENILHTLIVTTAFTEGVNTNACNLIFTSLYNGRNTNKLTDIDVLNAAGRAGRFAQKSIGNIYCISSEIYN